MRGRCLSVAGTGAGSNRLERFGGVAAFVAVIGRHISTSIGRFSGATGGSFGPPVPMRHLQDLHPEWEGIQLKVWHSIPSQIGRADLMSCSNVPGGRRFPEQTNRTLTRFGRWVDSLIGIFGGN